MVTKTKIVCTIGPAVETEEMMLALIDAGMNVARLNFSHGTQEEHLTRINNLKKAREKKKVPLSILMDTKGPEIRVGKMKNGAITVKSKQKILLVAEEIEGDETHFHITPSIALDALHPGMAVLFDDGYIISHVVERKSNGVVIEFENNGLLKSQKGVNIPNTNIELPAMTEQDKQDIIFGCQQDIDVIAASFIRSADHILEIKKLLVEQGKPEIQVIAKIENRQGVENIDSIIQAADGIMVARGDLGVELPLKQVPSLQKMMIRKCFQAYKPVVTATQMLESMIKNPRPTRAEVSDVANAIYDSTSAVMLSGETAIGQYPIETVKMMKSIVEEAEKDFNYQEFFIQQSRGECNDVSSSVAVACVKTGYNTNAKAIFTFTNSGFTARLISRFRPGMPIFALTPYYKTYHQLALSWGIVPVDPSDARNIQEAFQIVSSFALKDKLVSYGDRVVITAGSPFGVSGTTNMMIIETIGNAFTREQPILIR